MTTTMTNHIFVDDKNEDHRLTRCRRRRHLRRHLCRQRHLLIGY